MLNFEQVAARTYNAHSLSLSRNATTFTQTRAPKLAVNQHEPFGLKRALDHGDAPDEHGHALRRLLVTGDVRDVRDERESSRGEYERGEE